MFSCEYCEISKNSFFIEHTHGCFWIEESIILQESTFKICEKLSNHAILQRKLKVNESRYITFVFSGSIKKFFFNCVNIYLFSIFFSIDFVRCKNLLSIDCVNIYLFSLFSSQDFGRWKSVGLPPHSLHISRFINFNLHVTGPWCSFKKKFINICDAFSYSFSVFTSFSCV